MEAQNIYGIDRSGSLSDRGIEFMKSNDYMSNIVFILALIVIFIIIFNMVVGYFTYLLSPHNSPHLIDGMIDAKDSEMRITQDPNNSNSKTILPSSNQDEGIEFTWSFWVYLDNLDYRRGELKNIFVKGDNMYTQNNNSEDLELYGEINNVINGPGVYLTPHDNKLMFVFNTFENVIEKFEVDNIPMNKWLNVMIRCKGKTIDIFFNSVLTKRFKLQSLPKQNHNDVYIGKDGGFAGYLSNLWYYNYALGTREIANVYNKGANTNLLNDKAKLAANSKESSSILNEHSQNYLSFRWAIG